MISEKYTQKEIDSAITYLQNSVHKQDNALLAYIYDLQEDLSRANTLIKVQEGMIEELKK